MKHYHYLNNNLYIKNHTHHFPNIPRHKSRRGIRPNPNPAEEMGPYKATCLEAIQQYYPDFDTTWSLLFVGSAVSISSISFSSLSGNVKRSL